MKRVFMVLFTLCLWMGYTASDSEASLHLEGVQLHADQSSVKRQPVTNKVIELRGPEQQVSFFYEMKSDGTERNQELVLSFRHSELLIAPSSLTVHVDGKPVTSKLLNGEDPSDELVIPLQGDALKQGRHEVTVLFYGVIKEGVCVEQGTSGNWLAIQVDSYFRLSGQESWNRGLADYPAAFIGTGKYPVSIIIPQKASLETLDSALKTGAFLSEWTDEKYPVEIKREDQVKSLSSNVIIIGAESEFSSSYMKSILKQASLKSIDESLILSHETLTDGDSEIDALLAISETPEALAERIEILTDPALFEQMTGRQFQVKELPEKRSAKSGSAVTLGQFGMGDLTLNGANRESQQFFHYAPFTIDKNQPTILELHLKRSAPDRDKETATEEIFRGPVELTVLVNDVPHSINLDELREPQEGIYSVQLPIEKSAIQEKRMISLQLKGSGLMAKNPCVTTDHNRWIYIEKDSFFTFPREKSDAEHLPTFAQFPSPFIDVKNGGTIILPTVPVDDDSLLYLYRKLYLNSQPMYWKLADAGEIDAETLKEQHALFIGGPRVQPLLNAEQEKLTVPYTDGKPNLTSLGFMQEAAQSFSFIQPSIWGTKDQAMMVMDSLADELKIDRPLMDFLDMTDQAATVAVLSHNRKVYTNAALIEAAGGSAEAEPENSSGKPSGGWVMGFMVLVGLAAVSVFVMVRRSRRGVV